MRVVYSLFGDQEPRYILDAGALCGREGVGGHTLGAEGLSATLPALRPHRHCLLPQVGMSDSAPCYSSCCGQMPLLWRWSLMHPTLPFCSATLLGEVPVGWRTGAMAALLS